jgi:hypothetical protein
MTHPQLPETAGASPMTATLKNPPRASNLAVTKCYTGVRISAKRGIVVRPRLDIAKRKDFPARFAQRLRRLMGLDAGQTPKWTSRDVADLVSKAGVPVSDRAVDAWLRGQRLPKLKDIERVAKALGFDDYRDFLPVPHSKTKGKAD